MLAFALANGFVQIDQQTPDTCQPTADFGDAELNEAGFSLYQSN